MSCLMGKSYLNENLKKQPFHPLNSRRLQCTVLDNKLQHLPWFISLIFKRLTQWSFEYSELPSKSTDIHESGSAEQKETFLFQHSSFLGLLVKTNKKHLTPNIMHAIPVPFAMRQMGSVWFSTLPER